jgi:hypothetical protein
MATTTMLLIDLLVIFNIPIAGDLGDYFPSAKSYGTGVCQIYLLSYQLADIGTVVYQ